MKNDKTAPDTEQLPLELTVYQKILSSPHTFEKDCLYGFVDIANLIGTMPPSIRSRALADRWPLVRIHHKKGHLRKRHFVSGEFLRSIQAGGAA